MTHQELKKYFTITKQSHMGAIKRTITEDTIDLLKEAGLL